MSKHDDGGPAFPTESEEAWIAGMSLRDYFAGQALAGLMARNPGFASYDHRPFEPVRTIDDYAADAYAMADAMLAARLRKEDA